MSAGRNQPPGRNLLATDSTPTRSWSPVLAHRGSKWAHDPFEQRYLVALLLALLLDVPWSRVALLLEEPETFAHP